MKLTNKKVFVVALVVSLIAILSLGSLAWFNASDSVENKFMITDSETNPDDVFSVDVYETLVDENGDPVDPVQKTDSNTYDDIAPGDVLTKDPTVENTGKYDQWIRLNVTLTNAENWMSVLKYFNITTLETIFQGYDAGIWQSEGNDTPVLNADGSVTFTYYLKDKLTPGETATLFTAVKIPEQITQDEIVYINEFNLNIVAEALQADNTGDNCKAAFDAYWEK